MYDNKQLLTTGHSVSNSNPKLDPCWGKINTSIGDSGFLSSSRSKSSVEINHNVLDEAPHATVETGIPILKIKCEFKDDTFATDTILVHEKLKLKQPPHPQTHTHMEHGDSYSLVESRELENNCKRYDVITNNDDVMGKRYDAEKNCYDVIDLYKEASEFDVFPHVKPIVITPIDDMDTSNIYNFNFNEPAPHNYKTTSNHMDTSGTSEFTFNEPATHKRTSHETIRSFNNFMTQPSQTSRSMLIA